MQVDTQLYIMYLSIIHLYSLEEHGGVGHAGLLLCAEGGGHGPARGGLHAQPVVLLAPG